jgi:hypothetical protein
MSSATRTIAKTTTSPSTIHPQGVDEPADDAVVVDVVVGASVVVVVRCVVVVAGAVVVVVGGRVVVVVGATVVVVVGATVVVVVGWAVAGPATRAPTSVASADTATTAVAHLWPIRRMRAA